MALDTGLVVPVVKSADKLSLEEISVETKRLITLARAGDIGGDDIGGRHVLNNKSGDCRN